MKRLSFHDSLVDAVHLRNLLEHAGIACLIKNEQLCGALGEIPFLECLPEVWVRDDAQLARAEDLLMELRRVPPETGRWRCRDCNEINEPQFAACWRCGAEDAGGPTA